MLRNKKTAKFILILTLLAITGFSYFLIKFFTRPADFNWDQASNSVEVDYDGCFFKTTTSAKTVSDFIKEAGFDLGEDDYVFPPPESQLKTGLRLTVRRKVPFNIKVDDREIKAETFKETVNEVLAEAGVELNHLDEIQPAKEAGVFRGMEIVVTRINEEEITEEEKIDFEIIEKNDSELKWRKTVVSQAGEMGVRENTYLITYADGEQVSKVRLSSTITKKPVAKIILHGTKIEIGQTYKGRASWYAHTGTMACASLKHPLGTWLRVTNTATGRSVIVQVNDRGPFSEDKIIDLDKAAFEKIGNLAQGTMNVKVEEILD